MEPRMLTYSSWVGEKITMARAIASGCCGGDYAEGAIILCPTISAMSSEVWDSKKDDRRRFVEAVSNFKSPAIDATMVSVPLLSQEIPSCKQQLKVTSKAFHLRGATVDKTEIEVMTACPQLSVVEVRNYSYVNLLYKQIRCGFVHEFRAGDKAAAADPMRAVAGLNGIEISYSNGPLESNGTLKRKIHFPLEWIAEISNSIAQGLDIECQRDGVQIFQNLKLPIPARWWIDGP